MVIVATRLNSWSLSSCLLDGREALSIVALNRLGLLVIAEAIFNDKNLPLPHLQTKETHLRILDTSG